VSERTVRRLLDATPVDDAAEERVWAIVQASHAEREPVSRRPRMRAVLVLTAVAVAIAAAALSPPGRAVVHAVRKSIGIAGAQPALFRLPAPGRVLVSGSGGAWVVASDGSKRRLGDFREAAWSPHGLYVVASSSTALATLEPGGRVHWTLARRDIHFARWGGGQDDTRIAYLSAGRLRIVAGDGTGDARSSAATAAPSIAPAWRPGTQPGHVLAYVTTSGRVALLDTDRRAIAWISHAYVRPRSLAWSPDGKTLILAEARRIVLFDGTSGHAHVLPVAGVRGLAFSSSGRLALLRSHSVLLLAGSELRTLFSSRAALVGLVWSPDGRWLLTTLPGADQWVFIQRAGKRRILAVSHLLAQFGGLPVLDGWVAGA
jgi:WD40 repeat protein